MMSSRGLARRSAATASHSRRSPWRPPRRRPRAMAWKSGSSRSRSSWLRELEHRGASPPRGGRSSRRSSAPGPGRRCPRRTRTSPCSQTSSMMTRGPVDRSRSTSVCDHPRREALGHEPAVAVVLGRVHVEDRQAQICASASRSWVGMNVPPELGGEHLAVVADGAHVGVLGDRPEARAVGLGVPEDRRLAPQQVELVVGHARAPGVGQQVDAVESVRHVMRVRLLGVVLPTTPRRAATARSSVDGIGVDAAHHLEAEQQADDGGPAPAVGRPRRSTRARPRSTPSPAAR